MNLLHKKVYNGVCDKHKREDRQFVSRCKMLSKSFTPTALGLDPDYSGPYPLSLNELNRLPQLSSPLEKLLSLQEMMVLVNVCVYKY